MGGINYKPGAINIPAETLEARLKKLQKNKEYIAYCRGPFCVFADEAVNILSKKGSLGAEALNHAIHLEPVAMAESHLLLAWLYDRAGAKTEASREYKIFLKKLPHHPEAVKIAKYIQDNPGDL